MSKNAESEIRDDRQASILLGRRVDLTITLLIMVIAVVFIYLLQSLPERATFFPWFITISIMFVGSIYLTGKVRDPARWDNQYDPEAEAEHVENDLGPAYLVEYRSGVARASITFLLLILVTFAIGPKYSVPIFVTVMLLIGKENKIVAVLSGIFFLVITEYVFGNIMSINLPTGYFIDWLTS